MNQNSRTHHDLNVGPVDLQSTALPLSYTSPAKGVRASNTVQKSFFNISTLHYLDVAILQSVSRPPLPAVPVFALERNNHPVSPTNEGQRSICVEAEGSIVQLHLFINTPLIAAPFVPVSNANYRPSTNRCSRNVLRCGPVCVARALSFTSNVKDALG